jgi:hypothetical protein
MTGKLIVQGDGRVAGPAVIEYNDPFPTVCGSWGSGAMNGVIMHTMVGNLPGTITVFNELNPPDGNGPRSAHFGIDQAGKIHQFGPIGKGWIAWHIAAGNDTWYGIEHADDGNPDIPLTSAQLTASAQLVECLSAFAGFPLQISDSPSVDGYGTHSMGGMPWGGHTCPDSATHHVRSAQRKEVLARAQALRTPVQPPPPQPVKVAADGSASLYGLAAAYSLTVPDLIWQTAEHAAAGWGPLESRYLSAGSWDQPMPTGMIVWLGKSGQH